MRRWPDSPDSSRVRLLGSHHSNHFCSRPTLIVALPPSCREVVPRTCRKRGSWWRSSSHRFVGCWSILAISADRSPILRTLAVVILPHSWRPMSLLLKSGIFSGFSGAEKFCQEISFASRWDIASVAWWVLARAVRRGAPWDLAYDMGIGHEGGDSRCPPR
jgi:hypothetical protein